MADKKSYDQSQLNSNKANLTLDQREALISGYPLFCLLNQNDIHELAMIGKIEHFDPNTIIVKEGDIVDSFYLIASGTVNLSRSFATIEVNQSIQVATLGKGDAIGLTESGLSQRGLRTSTATSSTPLILLKFKLLDFYHFLKKSDAPYPGLKDVGEKIMLMNFLYSTQLFNQFSQEKITQFANRVKKLSVKSGTVLFNQNDIADKCYFILSGKIAIIAKDDHANAEHIIKYLGQFDLFGEGAFLEAGKRNAGARAEVDSDLYVLDRDQIIKFKATEDTMFSNTLNDMRIQQIRPSRKTDTFNIKKFNTDKGETITLLERNSDKKQFHLSPMHNVIWNEIDGTKSLLIILDNIKNQYSTMTLSDLYQNIIEMSKTGLIELPESESVYRNKKSPNVVGKFMKHWKRLWHK